MLIKMVKVKYEEKIQSVKVQNPVKCESNFLHMSVTLGFNMYNNSRLGTNYKIM